MSVGVMLVTHAGVATPLLEAAQHVLKVFALKVGLLEVPWAAEPQQLVHQANQLLRDLDSGSGVLILTDVYGATPANITERLEPCRKLRRVSGLNLPMLLRVLTYSDLKLDPLADIACEGGRAGILSDHA